MTDQKPGEKCPKCGAKRGEMIGPGTAVWQCGSRIGIFSGRPADEFSQSTTCRICELEQANAELTEKCELYDGMKSGVGVRIADLESTVKHLRDAIKRAGFAVMETSGDWSIHDVSDAGKRIEQIELDIATENIDLAIENASLRTILKGSYPGDQSSATLRECMETYGEKWTDEKIDARLAELAEQKRREPTP